MVRQGPAVTVFLLGILTLRCGEGELQQAPAEEDAGFLLTALGLEDGLAIAPLEALPPVDPGPTVERPLSIGHAVLWRDRCITESEGLPEIFPETRDGVVRLSGEATGLDLVDWRKKDALELIRMFPELTAAVHLAPRQLCDPELREALQGGASRELALVLAEGFPSPPELAACLGELRTPSLHLVLPQVDDARIQALASLPSLQTLILRNPMMGRDGIAALGKASGLRLLDLSTAPVEASSLAALSGLRQLEDLVLFGTPVDDTALSHLPNAGGLRSLDLGFTEVTDRGLERLAECRELRSLLLWHTKTGNEGVALLEALPHLVRLDLAATRIDDAVAPHLAAMQGLRRLDLTATAIGDPGVAHLASLPALERLDLGSTEISDGALLSLAAMPRLRNLGLQGTRVSAAAVDALAAARPALIIRHLP